MRRLLPPRRIGAAARKCGCALRRRGRLGPATVFWLLACVQLRCTSMTQGLLHGWSMLGRRGAPPTEEAFCQARAKLTLGFWREMLVRIAHAFDRAHGARMLWEGMRVLAVDGTTISLPRSERLAKRFGRPRNQHGEASGRVQARMVTACSARTGFCVGFVAAPLRFAEQTLLMRLLRRILRKDDLLLLDRGFFSYRLLQLAAERGAWFVLRLPAPMTKAAQRVRGLGKDHWAVEFRPRLTGMRRAGLPARFAGLRMVRCKRRGFRPTWLLTNLPAEQASAEEIAELYHWRWRIETVFREWKHALDVQNLRSRTPLGIMKELHAFVALSNLVRCTMCEAAGAATLPVELSFTTALTILQTMPAPRRFTVASARAWHAEVLRRIASAVIRRRPGRSYPRAFDHKPRNLGNGQVRQPHRTKRLA